MNILYFIFNIFSINNNNKSYNFNIFIPIVGIIMGVFISLITIAIMRGMEESIYYDLRRYSAPNKIYISHLSENKINSIINILKDKINYYRAIERKCIIKNNEYIKIINIKAIENLDDYFYKNFNIMINDTDINIIIGNNLHSYLGFSDQVNIISPADIDLFPSILNNYSYYVYSNIEFNIFDLDDNYAFIDLKYGKNIFKYSGNNYLYILDELPLDIISEIKKINNNIIMDLDDEFNDLIGAMKLEKILYSLFGVIIIILSSFNLMNIITNIIIRKSHILGILRVVGFSKNTLLSYLLSYTIIIGTTSIIIGMIISDLFIKIDSKYNYINYLFNNMILFNFNLSLNIYNYLFIFFISILIIIISSLYPGYLINKMSPITAIEYRR